MVSLKIQAFLKALLKKGKCNRKNLPREALYSIILDALFEKKTTLVFPCFLFLLLSQVNMNLKKDKLSEFDNYKAEFE